MPRTILLAVVASSAASATMTALILLCVLPSVVEAQVSQLVGSTLTVSRDDGSVGVSAEVGPPGGGILRVFGTDGKTPRLTLNSSGQATDGGIASNAGLNVYSVDGKEAVRVGSQRQIDGYGLSLRDAERVRLRIGVDGNGNPSIQMFDASDNVIWSAP
ncbi:MAG: hypothetical protein U0893_28655 [Chloroflexota bacterium]